MVVLYAAFWAASILYGLVPTPVAFVLMVAVTASGCILSWRHTSQVIASLGLIGGFLTPLLLSTGADRPIGLFGYVLLLDTGLLYLARQRRWPVLALLSLAGTVFYQALWIGTRMGPDRLLLGLAILGAFALLFAVAPRRAGGEEADLEWLIAQAGGVLVPFAFVLYFASSTRLGVPFHSYGILLVPLSAAAGWIARAQRTYRIGLGAAAATVAIVGVWLFTRAVGAGLAWEAALWCVLLALTFHVFVEWEREPGGQGSPAPPAPAPGPGPRRRGGPRRCPPRGRPGRARRPRRSGCFTARRSPSACWSRSARRAWAPVRGCSGRRSPPRSCSGAGRGRCAGPARSRRSSCRGPPCSSSPPGRSSPAPASVPIRSPGTGPRSPPPPGSSRSGASTCSASAPARSVSCPSRWRWCRSPPRCARASAGRRAIPFASA